MNQALSSWISKLRFWKLNSSDLHDEVYDELLQDESVDITFTDVNVHIEIQHLITSPKELSLIYGIFFLQGASMLLVWNVFITASEFFKVRFTGSGFERTFSSWFSFGFMASQLIFLWHATMTQRKVNVSNRISSSLVINCIALAITTISTLWFPFGSSTYFYFIMLTILICGINGSYLQNGLIALVTRFDATNMQAIMSGQGAIGTAVALVQIITASSTTKVISVSDVSKSAFIFFLLSTVFSVISLFAHYYLLSISTTQHILRSYNLQNTSSETITENTGASIDVIRKVARKTVLLIYSITSVFAITLCVFPALTVSITSDTIPSYIFIPLHFLVFNTGDWIGRALPGWKQFIFTTSDKTLAILTTFRILFIPMLLACNTPSHNLIPHIFHNDVIYMLLLLFMSFSNGYVSSLVMMNQRYVEPSERDMAGTLLAYMLSVGLTLGSLMSFVIIAVI